MMNLIEAVNYIKVRKDMFNDLAIFGMVLMVCEIYHIEQDKVMKMIDKKNFSV